MLAKIRDFVKKHRANLILFLMVVLISLFSFAAGYITAKLSEKEPLKFEQVTKHVS